MLVATESEGRIPLSPQPVPVLIRVLPQRSADEPQQWSVSGTLEIGRDVSADHGVRLADDGKVSKRHATLRLVDNRLLLEDLKSKNHTYLNGEPVTSAQVRAGDVIRVGGTLLVVQFKLVQERDALPQDSEIRSRLLGYSSALRQLRNDLSKAARSSAPALLVAPTGTGKELCAEAIHAQSGRPMDRLVRVNCAGVASSLTESELFGHERDAFSGARRAHKGLFQQAHGGTLFLDEVGDMPAELQPKLLRVLQPVHPLPPTLQGGTTPCILRVRPVGAEGEVDVDVRIIAATNVDMEQAVAQGRFRSDLHQRLQIVTIRLPTLATRRDDILWLLHHYLNLGRPEKDWRTVTARLAELLLLYSWPGNVRELIGVTQRLLLYAPVDQTLDLDVLPPEDVERFAHRSAEPAPEAASSDEDEAPRQQITRELLQRLLAENQGNISKIARALARSPRQIRRRLQELGLLPSSTPGPVPLDAGLRHVQNKDDRDEQD